MDKKKRTLLRSAVLGITALATSLTIGMSTACSTSGGSSSDDDDEKTTTKIDEQTIKNGNFEFYSDNKGLYPISKPDSWTQGSNGSSSNSMSGIIDTSKARWDYVTDPGLAQTLEDNDDLESTDENKKDYNGALADDLPYKNTHTATDTGSSSTDDGTDPKAYIANPFTPKYSYNEDGVYVGEDGNTITTYNDENGKVFLDADFKQPLETSVLMLHNFRRSDYYGAETYYSSATTVSLEANTAAEISLWVKTTEMYFGGSSTKEERETARIEFDRGAYIKVNTQVGGNSLDAFVIRNINTEQLIKDNPDIAAAAQNGWIQYTVYVAASSFATTTVNLTLGLGENEAGTVEGYAFFDDVTIKKYNSVADMEKQPGYNEKIHEANSDADDSAPDTNICYPLTPDAQTEFRVDVEKVKTNMPDNSSVTDKIYKNNSADRYFLIDFANSAFKSHNVIGLNTENVTAGLTVEETNSGKFACYEKTDDNTYKTNLSAVNDDKPYIPNSLRNNGIKSIKDDLLVTAAVKDEEGWKLSDQISTDNIETDYDAVLTEALKTAPKLPGTQNDSTRALVMLSSYGAAYEAHIKDDSFVLTDDQYMLVSFWLKTSDMNGKTAATVTVKGLNSDDKDIKSSFTVDTTTLNEITIGEGDDKIENAYNGWARCFVRVSNTSKDKTERPFEIVVNFGTTAISTSTKASYKAGWLALTNLSVMELDEDVYGYTSGASQTATIEFGEPAEKTSHQFDTELGEKNEIKTDLATPASYTGVNGKSNFIERGAVTDLDGYHDTNKNDYAGILSKENFANYTEHDWYNKLTKIETDNDAPEKLWNAVFGDRTVQPLLIVNTPRTFKNSDPEQNSLTQTYNYGYIGKSASVSASSYKAVSVRVKASAGAIANVYLVEDKTGGNVLSYVTPEYNFRYDADGNILKGEPKENATAAEQKANIAYTLRTDGLYENDGKLYANFYNLTKQYDISFEHESFFDGEGKPVKFENLVKGEVYYANAEMTAYAPHYLIAGGKDNNKVYLYSGEGVGDKATYYYVENGTANKNKLVNGVDKSIARYVNTDAPETPYRFEIDTTTDEGKKYAGEWITVTFYIHTGAEAKNYKLELWSGRRDETTSYAESTDPSYVVFDYSNYGASLNQSDFDNLVDGYSQSIITEYKKFIVNDLDKELEDNDANIADLKELAGKKLDLYDYEAAYYTFSLYDSEAFIPFNGEINTDETGYSFDYTESAEALAYLKVADDGLSGKTDADKKPVYTMSSFIDYSVIDKDVDIIGEPTAPGTSDSNTSTTSSGGSSNVWLLASSIILVAAMLLAIAALFIRDFVKKHKGRKSSSKNSYNFTKNKRYVKQYVKANGEAPVIEEGEVDESLLSDEVKTEAPAEETVEEPVAEPATEETVGTPAPVAEETVGTPAAGEETPTATEEEKPTDDGKEEE